MKDPGVKVFYLCEVSLMPETSDRNIGHDFQLCTSQWFANSASKSIFVGSLEN